LRNKIITYVKNEGSNWNTMTSVQKFVMKCEILFLEETKFQGIIFGRVFPKVTNTSLTMRKFIGPLNMLP
jgi:hypothetical protein